MKTNFKNSRFYFLFYRFSLVFLLSTFYFLFSVFSVLAADITIFPAIINEKALPRDILTGRVTLKNETQRKLDVYAVVYNLSEAGEEIYLDPSQGDKTASLAHWLEISRGAITLAPQEQKEIPYKIEVNLWAKPGNYYAAIYFASGNTRAEAEKNLGGAARLTINIEVLEDAKERLQLKKFVPQKTFFDGLPADFIAEIENIGNRPLAPSGELRIYNRRGEEITALIFNEAGKTIEPGQTKEFPISWREGRAFGKYKAYLDLKYGSRQNQSLQDTAFFWVAPWKKILIIFAAVSILIVILSLIIHRKIYK